MFYTEVVLGRKGPLARVWLAAHSEKKLTKAQIVETNIAESIEAILTNKYNLALRTSSHLLVGIVRIYDRKLAYLLVDCREALAKVKRGLRPAAIQKATVNAAKATKAVTLPDAFYDFDDETFDVPVLPTEETNGFGDIGLEETDSVMMQDERALNGLEELMQPEFGDPADMNMFLEEDVSNEPEESRKSTMHISDDGNVGGGGGGEFDVDQPGLDDPNLDAIIPEENEMQESEIERLDLDAFKPPPAKKRRVADFSVNQQQTKRATQVDEDVEVERASYRAWLADTSDLIEAVPKPGPRKANPFRRNEWPRNDVLENGLMVLSDSDDDDDDDEEVLQPEGNDDEGLQLDDVGSPLATIHEVTEGPSVPGGDMDHDNVNENEEEEEDVVEEGEGEIGSEELEERRWSKRTEKMVALLRTEMKSDDETVSFFGMVRNHSRSQVAAKFYALLVLSRNQVVSLKQEKAYGDIAVGKGEAFDHY